MMSFERLYQSLKFMYVICSCRLKNRELSHENLYQLDYAGDEVQKSDGAAVQRSLEDFYVEAEERRLSFNDRSSLL